MQEPNSNSLVSIATSQSGFYEGFNKVVALSPKILILMLIGWVVLDPEGASKALLAIQNWSINSFGGWYIYVSAFYLLVCLGLSVWPKSGKIKLGRPDEEPEFSTFTWFAMMFSAGLGVGMLTYSTAEPVFQFANNPDTIRGFSDSLSENNITIESDVNADADYFKGHFPNMPVMPGVLIIETVAQAGALLISLTRGLSEDKFIAFSNVDAVKFRRPVTPNDTLTVDVSVEKIRLQFYKFTGKATVNGKIVATLKFAAVLNAHKLSIANTNAQHQIDNEVAQLCPAE